jgi:hypothetical protein
MRAHCAFLFFDPVGLIGFTARASFSGRLYLNRWLEALATLINGGKPGVLRISANRIGLENEEVRTLSRFLRAAVLNSAAAIEWSLGPTPRKPCPKTLA